MTVTINIDMDRKCAECGKGGAVDSGICLKCTTKAFGATRMKSETGRAVQDRIRNGAKAERGSVIEGLGRAVAP